MARFKAQFRDTSLDNSQSTVVDLRSHWKRSEEKLEEKKLLLRKRVAERGLLLRKNIHKKKKKLLAEWKSILKNEGTLYAEKVYRIKTERAEEECLNLALEIAKKFIGEERLKRKGLLIDEIKREIANIQEKKNITLFVHPKKRDLIAKELEEERAFVQIKSDEKIAIEKARIETSNGALLIDWENEFSELARKLHRKLHEEWLEMDSLR